MLVSGVVYLILDILWDVEILIVEIVAHTDHDSGMS